MKVLRKFSRYSLLVAALFVAACNGDNEKTAVNSTPPEAPADQVVPKLLPFDIVKEYPHQPTAFTEGLEFKDGFFYEGTGEYGASDIRKVDAATGKVLASTEMEAKYFGEGITILNGKIYQLTYKEGKGFIYDEKTLKQIGTFDFGTQEGWGMTNNGAQLIFDDGTNVLHYMDPTTFKEVKRLTVTDEHGPVNEINELELINGYIYANQWQRDIILKIDTTTGHVVGRADLSSIRQRGGIPPVTDRRGAPEVLNGIAYDKATNRIFVTGKNWPKVFEIKLDN